MTLIELHPDDLLDKEADGDLTAEERARLDAHLERCAACRAERVLRADFAAELGGGADADALAVRAALEAAQLAKDAEARGPTPEVERANLSGDAGVGPQVRAEGARRRRRAAVLFVAAAALLATAAGATELGARLFRGRSGPTEAGVWSSAETRPAPAVVAASSTVRAVVSAPTSTPEPETELATEAAQVAVPAVATVAAAPVRPAPAPTAGPPAPATASVDEPSASELFTTATAARREGDLGRALSLYDVLAARYPNSREARASLATTGRLLLDRGDARGALVRFDSYLASGAPELREEAMAGRARALERLDRRAEEARAWSSLLAAYPSTGYAEHARARIGSIEGE